MYKFFQGFLFDDSTPHNLSLSIPVRPPTHPPSLPCASQSHVPMVTCNKSKKSKNGFFCGKPLISLASLRGSFGISLQWGRTAR